MFINGSDLRKRIQEDASLVIFDIPFDLSQEGHAQKTYAQGHIPGAFLVDLAQDLCASEGPGNHPFLDAAALVSFLEAHGVTAESALVLYDRNDLAGPARCYCQLKELGLNNVQILNGGLAAYLDAGGPLAYAPTALPAQASQLDYTFTSSRISIEDVRASMEDAKTLLIDSRAKSRYLGHEEPLYPVAGHIPTAVSYDYQLVQDQGRMKPIAFLKDHFAGVDAFDTIILSCGSGVSACVNSLALDLLGLPHVLYNGSYSEWIADPENPIETCDRPLDGVTLDRP